MAKINKNVLKTIEIFGNMKYDDVRREIINGNLLVDTIVKISSKYHNLLHEISEELINYDRGLLYKDEYDYEITILYLAFYFDDEEFFDYLIQNKANISLTTTHFGHIMTYAIKFKKLKYVVKLIDSGMDANESLYVIEIGKFCSLYTLLQQAVLCNSCEILEFLISRCTSIEIEDNFEYPHSILNLAAYNGCAEVMDLLINKYNCDINQAVVFEMSFEPPLESAFKKEFNEKTVKILLNHPSIDINQRNWIKKSYLHRIIELPKSESYAKLVLDAGCDVNLMDKNEKLVIDYTYDYVYACLPDYLDMFDKYYHISMLAVKHHIVKLIVADFYVCDKNIRAVSDKEFDKIHKKCLKEIRSMKKKIKKDSVTGLTYYDILHKPQYKLALILENSDDNVTFNEKMIESKFPLYGGMINYRLAKAFQCRKILDVIAHILFNVFFRVFSANYLLLVLKIFNFISRL